MKVRNGFVSNSSSSSFIIAGISIDNNKSNIKDLFKRFGLEFDDNRYDYDKYDFIGELRKYLEPKGLDYIVNYDDDKLYIGSNIRVDEYDISFEFTYKDIIDLTEKLVDLGFSKDDIAFNGMTLSS